MSSVEESAHGSTLLVSPQENSAHRSSEIKPSPWSHKLGVTETLSVPTLFLAPVIEKIDDVRWSIRRRYTMTVRGHRRGRPDRTLRFFTQRGLERAHQAYLDAHRRVYRYWYQDIPIT